MAKSRVRVSVSTLAVFAMATFFGVVVIGAVRVFVFDAYRSGFPAAAQVALQSYILLGIFASLVGALLVALGANLRQPSRSSAEGTVLWAARAGLVFALLIEAFQTISNRLAPDSVSPWHGLLAIYPLLVGLYPRRPRATV